MGEHLVWNQMHLDSDPADLGLSFLPSFLSLSLSLFPFFFVLFCFVLNQDFSMFSRLVLNTWLNSLDSSTLVLGLQTETIGPTL
jgi:hypothetical protein